MTKDEILEKSRRENNGTDERELQIMQKAKAISQTFSLSVCAFLMLICIMTDGPMLIANAAWTIVSIMYATENLFLAIKLKKPIYWVFAVFWVLASFAFLRVLGNAFV